MLKYLIVRILLLIPVLFLAVLLTLSVTGWVEQDILKDTLSNPDATHQPSKHSASREKAMYQRLQQLYGFGYPVFYFHIQSACLPKQYPPNTTNQEVNTIKDLAFQNGNSQQTITYFTHRKNICNTLLIRYPHPLWEEIINANSLKATVHNIDSLQRTYPDEPLIWELMASTTNFFANTSRYKVFIPTLVSNGYKNKFHIWVSNLIKGDLGYSFADKRAVSKTLSNALPLTLALNVISLIVVVFISLFLALWMAHSNRTWMVKTQSVLLDIGFALPQFWIASLLIYLFSMPFIPINIPTSGYGESGFSLSYFILPVICLSLPAIAITTKTLRSALLQTLQEDFIRTAYAKGLTKFQVLIRHTLPMAFLAVLPIFSSLIAGIITGSVIIETLFSIPGLGSKGYAASRLQDYPVILALLLLSVAIGIFSNILNDVLLHLFDPRIRFYNKKQQDKP